MPSLQNEHKKGRVSPTEGKEVSPAVGAVVFNTVGEGVGPEVVGL